ncbi:hypothetical protein QG37_06048 [Candidozyma auris]|uniref:Uncharacterized protein n=1 Tax=Candidozyma auris TaxID=498019 RepID=A0A0L0NUI1_CANAR|nr:hypothetical protein QG37_06048 [[Candida] auris]
MVWFGIKVVDDATFVEAIDIGMGAKSRTGPPGQSA